MHTSKITRWLVTAAATLSLTGAVAVAQYGPPPGGPPPPQGQWDDAHWGNGPQGYSDYYHENGQPNFGARRGYATGFDLGMRDRQTGHSFRPTEHDEYKHVPDSPHGVPRQEFKNFYREAFMKGYQRGYNGR